MPRYYFEIETSAGRIPDDEGIEMNSLPDVFREAEGAARQLLADAIITDKEPPSAIVVYDDYRQKVAEIQLKNLIPISLR